MEVDASEFSSFVASQEVENHERVSVILRETVARLEEDCKNLRKREQSDRETIKRLLEEMEKKERNFREKLLEIQCKKNKAESEVLVWKNKYSELEDRVSKKLAGECVAGFGRKEMELKEKLAKLADDDNDLEARAMRVSDENCTLEGKVNSHLKEKEKKLTVDVDDGEDEIPLSELYRKKRLAELYEGDKKDSHYLKECFSSLKLIEPGCEGARGIKTTKPVEESNRGPSLRKKLKKSNLSCSLTARKQGSIGYIAESSRGPSLRKKFKKSDLSCSLTARKQGSIGYIAESNRGPSLRKKLKKSDLSCSLTARKQGSIGYIAVAEKGIPSYNRRNSMNQTHRVYTGRTPSSEQREHAEKRAQILQKSWRSCNPTFIKTMGVSHVSASFWLNIPVKFCKENLPAYDQQMILQDEEGLEYKVNYICKSTGFSGGWLGFAKAHKLELGDALLFELHGPARFKVYIIKAIPQESSKDFDHNITGGGIDVDKLTSANSAESQDILLSDNQVISESLK